MRRTCLAKKVRVIVNFYLKRYSYDFTSRALFLTCNLSNTS